MNLGKISREDGSVPLYQQMKLLLLDLVRSGKVKTGDAIPPENTLCKEFGVSRGTVRTAVGELVKTGFLRREQGRGTFVAGPRFERSLLQYFNFAEKNSSKAIIPESRILGSKKLIPPVEIAKILKLSVKDRVVEIRRLRMVKGIPFIYQVSFFPERPFPGLERIDAQVQSLYDHIVDRFDVRVARVEEYLTAGVPNREAMRLLDLEKDTPVMIIERVAFIYPEKPIEFRRSFGRADKYYYHVRL